MFCHLLLFVPFLTLRAESCLSFSRLGTLRQPFCLCFYFGDCDSLMNARHRIDQVHIYTEHTLHEAESSATFCKLLGWPDYDFFVDHVLQAHQLGKREQDYQMEGRHTEGVWGPGKRKRVLQPPGLRGGTVWWTPRPTGTSIWFLWSLWWFLMIWMISMISMSSMMVPYNLYDLNDLYDFYDGSLWWYPQAHLWWFPAWTRREQNWVPGVGSAKGAQSQVLIGEILKLQRILGSGSSEEGARIWTSGRGSSKEGQMERQGCGRSRRAKCFAHMEG